MTIIEAAALLACTTAFVLAAAAVAAYLAIECMSGGAK